MVGAGCVLPVSVRVVRRLLGIRRHQVGGLDLGENNRPVCDSQKAQLLKEFFFSGFRLGVPVLLAFLLRFP